MAPKEDAMNYSDIIKAVKDLGIWKDIATRETSYVSIAKTEAIKEFAEKLKNKFYSYYEGLDENTGKSKYNGETLMYYEVADMIENCIDNTVEEMTEGKG
jgi:hypothetical protein